MHYLVTSSVLHPCSKKVLEKTLSCHILSWFSTYITCPNICPMYGLVQCTCHHEKASHYNVFQSPVVFSKPVSFQTHCELSSTSVQHHFLSESCFRLPLYVLPQKASKEQPPFNSLLLRESTMYNNPLRSLHGSVQDCCLVVAALLQSVDGLNVQTTFGCDP